MRCIEKMTIKLIVGLGNIGLHYANTRHNLGSEYVKLIAKKYNIILCKNKKLSGYIGKLQLNNNLILLFIPNSYINKSGVSVSACVNTYQLFTEEILIAHDDLDVLPGKIKIKLGNKLNDSHRGLQDIVMKLKNKVNFYRLRIGIGRPINKDQIVDFVLSPPSIYERNIINGVINEVAQYTEDIISKNFNFFMNKLHLYYSHILQKK